MTLWKFLNSRTALVVVMTFGGIVILSILGIVIWLVIESSGADMSSALNMAWDWGTEIFLDTTLFQLILTGTLALFTYYLVRATNVLASETRQMRELQTAPRFDIRVETAPGGGAQLDLVIRNEGQGPARNVRFTFEGDPSYYRGTLINSSGLPEIPDLPIIKNGLASWEAGRTFSLRLGTATGKAFSQAREEPWVFQVIYEDLSGKQSCETIEVDFSLLQGTMFENDHLRDISNSLKTIQRDLSRLTRESTRINVVTQPIDERRREREAYVNPHSSSPSPEDGQSTE